MPDCLNARMAAALAPVLGEAAVYTREFVCRYGHKTTEKQWQFRKSIGAYECAHEDASGKWCAQPLHASTTEPKDFADPAVGWGVLEKYLNATSSYLTLDHNTEGSVFEAHVFPDLAYQFVHEGYADTAWGAVIMAWARAMGVGEVSGDA